MIRPQQQQAPTVGAAPALPGLAVRRAPGPAAATVDPTALSPNAALFDAITRGDLGAARDAVGRGASIEARNPLGLTPLDAAVDHGRSDIVFYLLSTRDMTRGPVISEPASARPAPQPAAAPRPAPQPAAAPRPAPQREAAAAPAMPRTAQLWAGNGGAARPDAGFLGFDAGRPAGATPPPASRGGRS
jgi:ankyrin repeat protein